MKDKQLSKEQIEKIKKAKAEKVNSNQIVRKDEVFNKTTRG